LKVVASHDELARELKHSRLATLSHPAMKWSKFSNFPYKNAAHMLLTPFGQILACCIQVTHVHIQADVCCTYAENLGARKTNLCLPAHMLHARTHMQHISATCMCAARTAAHMQHAYCSYRYL